MPTQPATTVWAIRLIIILAFVLLGLNGFRVAGKLRLSPELSGRVKYYLKKRHDAEKVGESEQLTDAEEAELATLIAEYE